MENLTRGVAAVKQPDKSVFVSWRLFGTDPQSIAFNVYRIADGKSRSGQPKPITDSTNCLTAERM